MFSFGLKFLLLIFLSIGFLAKPVIANDIFTAQRLLTELGYAPGPIDGAYGGKTKKAFVELYKDQNMIFDGVVDKNELDLLKNLIAKINRPIPKRPVGINAKKAGKKRKSSIDVSPYLWPTNSKTQNNIHKKSTDVLILPNF